LAWHYRHLLNPRELEPDSIMPSYVWLKHDDANRGVLFGRITALRTLGVPYKPEASTPAAINASYEAEAGEIVKQLAAKGITARKDEEMVALLAYLKCLGLNVEKTPTPQR
jgi:cytochrome c oxidase cbb3-type subunit I/II